MENATLIWAPKPTDDLALKPCPFCGNKEPVYVQYEHPAGLRWKVTCPDCLAEIDPGYAQARHIVMDMWNKRAKEATA